MNEDNPLPDGQETTSGSASLEPKNDTPPLVPFQDLTAPDPIEAAPSTPVRWLAFAGIVVGGLLGTLVGYGIGDILYPDSLGSAVGALVGGSTGAVGVGVLANLTLRAMNEWKTASHPEAATKNRANRANKAGDHDWTRRPSA